MKFIPNLASLTEPLRALLSKKNEWCWGPMQDQAFQKIKESLSDSPVLKLFDPALATKVSADSSSYGLGAVLSQKHHGEWSPVAYASRSLTATERRYAQVEKEALASTWACERFSDYIIGKDIILETDHKPLISLLDMKDIDQLPARIQRMRMRLMRFAYTTVHVPGKNLNTADTLSRAPLMESANDFEKTIMSYVNQVVGYIPITNAKMEHIKWNQQEDEVCRQIFKYVEEGWPEKHQVKGLLSLYYQYKSEFNMIGDILLMGVRVVIPSSIRLEVLDSLHEGHQGMVKCKALAKHSIWWPGIGRDIEELVRNCRKCAIRNNNRPEPLIPTSLPERPWQYLATDTFEYEKRQYLIVVDYFSRWIEIEYLKSLSSTEVVKNMKRMFARWGIPDMVRSDNARCYDSNEFRLFAMNYGFKHITSSPGHSSGNGEAERGVQTVKNLMACKDDFHLALLNYRASPLKNGHSPAELMMSRKLKTKVPIAPVQLKPALVDTSKLHLLEENSKIKQKQQFDRRHAAKPLVQLKEGDEVYIYAR